MPNQTRIVAPGSGDRTVRTADGQILYVPADWELLPPGDAGLTRRVKAAGPTWTVQEKKGRKTFSRGIWAPANRIAMIRAALDAERATGACAKRRAAETARRERKQTAYDNMKILRVKGQRREVRRMLAEQSRRLLEKYRTGSAADPACPLQQALSRKIPSPP